MSKFCPNCQVANDSSYSFCNNCGARLPDQQPNPSQTVHTQQPYQQPNPAQPVYPQQPYQQHNPSQPVYPQQPSPYPSPAFQVGTYQDGPKGLSGWLVIVGLGLIFSIVQIAMTLSQITSLMSNVADEYKGLLWFEILVNIFLIGFCGYCLYLFFKKKRSFINVFVSFYVIGFALSLLDYILTTSTFDVEINANYLIINLAKMVVWTWYIKQSRRAKNTFVE